MPFQYPRRIKDKNSRLDFPVDWSQWLSASGDTISSVQWIVPSGLTVILQTHTDKIATVWLSGGVNGSVYQVTCRPTTVAGRVEDFTFELVIEEK